MELLCRCDDIPDDGIELRVLKGLLTAVTSNAVHVHGQALLLVRLMVSYALIGVKQFCLTYGTETLSCTQTQMQTMHCLPLITKPHLPSLHCRLAHSVPEAFVWAVSMTHWSGTGWYC